MRSNSHGSVAWHCIIRVCDHKGDVMHTHVIPTVQCVCLFTGGDASCSGCGRPRTWSLSLQHLDVHTTDGLAVKCVHGALGTVTVPCTSQSRSSFLHHNTTTHRPHHHLVHVYRSKIFHTFTALTPHCTKTKFLLASH